MVHIGDAVRSQLHSKGAKASCAAGCEARSGEPSASCDKLRGASAGQTGIRSPAMWPDLHRMLLAAFPERRQVRAPKKTQSFKPEAFFPKMPAQACFYGALVQVAYS